MLGCIDNPVNDTPSASQIQHNAFNGENILIIFEKWIKKIKGWINRIQESSFPSMMKPGWM